MKAPVLPFAASQPAKIRAETLPPRLTLKAEGGYVFLDLAEIRWIEAQGDYVKFHAGEQTCLCRLTMSALASRLPPGKFLRIHRSRFANIDHVERIVRYGDPKRMVVLREGRRLAISASCWMHLKARFESADRIRSPRFFPAITPSVEVTVPEFTPV